MTITPEGLKGLKGKKVCIVCRSDYDQVSNQLIVSERIEGVITKIYETGIGIKNITRKKYVNNMFHGDLQTPSKSVIIFFNMIEAIYLL